MSESPWEIQLVNALGEDAWDEGTELVSTVADELPSLIDADARHDLALGIVLLLVTDVDLVRMIHNLHGLARRIQDSPA